MPALAALPEQSQPLPALRRCRRGEPAQAGKTKEAAAGEGEQLSWSDQKCKVRKAQRKVQRKVDPMPMAAPLEDV